MSFGRTLHVLDAPLDVDALRELVNALPGAQAIADSPYDVRLGPSDAAPLVAVGPDTLSVALRWSDNVYEHAGLLLDWVLTRHRCRGVDLDWGADLPDNAACRRHMTSLGLRPSPHTRERAQQIASSALHGSVLWEFSCRFGDVRTLSFARDGLVTGRVLFEQDQVDVDAFASPWAEGAHLGLDPDVRFTLHLHDRLWSLSVCETIEVLVGGALLLGFEDQSRLHFSQGSGATAPDAIWTILDPDGVELVVSDAGGGLRVLDTPER